MKSKPACDLQPVQFWCSYLRDSVQLLPPIPMPENEQQVCTIKVANDKIKLSNNQAQSQY